MPEAGGERVQAVACHSLYGECAVEAVVDDVHSGGGELGAYLVRDGKYLLQTGSEGLYLNSISGVMRSVRRMRRNRGIRFSMKALI